jgi:pimeloyl-ACP methyl ester carboxylesterase
MQPETRYARLGRDRIAYQVFGKGPPEVVLIIGSFSHMDVLWEDPAAALFFRNLASFARIIRFDRLGVGASDPLSLDALPHGSRTPRNWPRSWTPSASRRPRSSPSWTPARWGCSLPPPDRSGPPPSS